MLHLLQLGANAALRLPISVHIATTNSQELYSLVLNLPDLKGSIYLRRHLAPAERLEIFWGPSGHASKPLTLHLFPICPEILHFQCRPRESFRLIWVARKAQKERLETTLYLKPEKSHRKPRVGFFRCSFCASMAVVLCKLSQATTWFQKRNHNRLKRVMSAQQVFAIMGLDRPSY